MNNKPRMALEEIFKNIGLVFLSIAILFEVSEVIARMVYVKPWYVRLIEEQASSNLVSQRGREPHRKNKYQLRDPNYSSLKPSHCKRVLILGDSFTYGVGVRDDSKVFPALLEKDLNLEFSHDGKKIEILNGGMSGSLTEDWIDLLLKVKDPFKPDVVLIVFFLRDGTSTTANASFFGPIRQEIQSRDDASFVYRHVYLYRLIRDYFDRSYLSRKYSEAIRDSYFGDPEQTKEWERAKNNIIRIKDIAGRIHAKVGLVVFPILVELNQNYPFKDVCACVLKFGAERGIPERGLLDAFMGKNAPDLWVSKYNQHPNEQGHLIAANSILPFLRKLIDDQ